MSFDVAAEYRGRVASLELEIYELAEDNLLTCDQIAYHDLIPAPEPSQRLRFAPGDEITPTALRLGRKLFVGRGLDVEGLLVAAGCEERGEVSGLMHVDLELEPAAVVRVAAELGTQSMGLPLPSPTRFEVRDVNDRPLGGVELKVTQATAAGSQRPATLMTTSSEGTLDVIPRRVPGPGFIDVQPRWPRFRPEVVFGFEPPTQWRLDFANPVWEYEVGLVDDNAWGVALLVEVQSQAVARVERWICDGSGPLARISARSLGLGVLTVASARREVFFVNQDEIVSVATGTRVNLEPPLAEIPMLAIPAGSCDPLDLGGEVVLTDWHGPDPVLYSYSTTGSRTANPLVNAVGPSESIRGHGCISDQSGGLVRGFVYVDFSLNNVAAARLAVADGTTALLRVFPEEVGFTWGTGATLVAAEVTPGGSRLQRYTLDRPADNVAELRVGDADGSVGVPLAVAGGHLDADQEPDIVALVQLMSNTTALGLHVVLGATHRGRRIAGVIPVEMPDGVLGAAGVEVVDIDCDGYDDIVFLTPNETGSSLLVYSGFPPVP